MTAPHPGAHEHLPGVPHLCDHCWHPIERGAVSWRHITDIPVPTWAWWHTACLLATTREDQP